MQITVNGQNIAIVDDTLVSNSVNIYECEFEFDASWDGFNKTSVWQLNSGDPIEVVIESGVAVIPHEVLENAGILRIGVYGTKDEKVMPTVWLEKRKVYLGTPTGSIGTEPTPSTYAQILALSTEAKDIAEEVQSEWESVSVETTWNHIGELSNSGDSITFNVPVGASGMLVIDNFISATNRHDLYIHPFFRESWGISVGGCPFSVSTDYSFTQTNSTVTVTLTRAYRKLRIASIGTNKLTVEE